MDVFVLSSRHEGLSIALVEAMALGRPVVVTRVGGLPEVVDDGQEGLLVPPGDPAALAAGIAALLGDGDLRRRMGEAARRRARGLDVRHAVRRTEELYAELVADRPPIPAGRRG
jgi:glycosyltransferase involved in cell wall biosynthesis